MSQELENIVSEICASFGNDRGRLMDIVRTVQARLGYVSGPAMDFIAKNTSARRVEVEGLVSFYSFFSTKPKGKVVIRLCNDIIDQMHGGREVASALASELGIEFGQSTPDQKISLEYTPCIGMCDQAPAALVNEVVVTSLTPESARHILRELKEHGDPQRLVKNYGDSNNAHRLIRAMVKNNIREKGPVIFGDFEPEAGLKKALSMPPVEVIDQVKAARLRGRGGAGFPTGMKWEFTRAAPGDKKVVICNADEGEPGTFKDRVLLTEFPDLVFEGMTIEAYAVGADLGLMYLRGEYAYLRPWLEHVLSERRSRGLLGRDILGKTGFNFDVRIQMGAGAYICGEETALISSCEGLRGDPKNRPPFPAQKGYMGLPTAVNNVETYCCAVRILDRGPGWFAGFGSEKSTGTKLLSVSGDCGRPGIYEVPFGISLREVLKKAEGEEALAVQVGGASGVMVGEKDFSRLICFDDLATGGAFMIFGPGRNLLEVVQAFMEFFIEESCGYCTPCRVGNVLLKQKLDHIINGKGERGDLEYLLGLGEMMRATSRCGLGQTSPNPIVSSIKNFRPLYEELLKENEEKLQRSFDIKACLAEAERLAGRKSLHA